MNKVLKTKMELESLRTQICINHQNIQDELWLTSNTPHMHKHYEKRLDNDIKTYLKTLRPLLENNKEYVLNLCEAVIPYDEKKNFVKFLYDNMVYGEYQTEHDNYFYDKSKPGKIHKYCDAGRGTMNENKSEIIECLHLSKIIFYVNIEGNTIINGFLNSYDNEIVNVEINKNIFDTDLIANISLVTI